MLEQIHGGTQLEAIQNDAYKAAMLNEETEGDPLFAVLKKDI